MRIRKYKPEDAGKVDEIYNRCHAGTFNLPNLNNTLDAAIVEIDNKIAGFGCLEMMIEAVMIMDTDLTLRKRITVLKELFQVAKFRALDGGFTKYYMFPSDTNYMNLMIKHFKFEKCEPLLSVNLVRGDKEDG